jgi:hypothetical protein
VVIIVRTNILLLYYVKLKNNILLLYITYAYSLSTLFAMHDARCIGLLRCTLSTLSP